MTIALLATAASGCLILDPIDEIGSSGNTKPRFFQIIPGNTEPVFLANTNAVVVFKGKATDDETPKAQLVYEWTIDNGSVVQEGPDSTEFITSGAALGAGLHLIGVLVTDDGLPTGFETLEWQVQVQ